MRLHLSTYSIPLVMLMVGCGPGNPLGRQAVDGRVTLDGALLDHGTIEFDPQASGGVSSGATITNGAYSLPTAQGLPPGKYVVRIGSTAPNPKAAEQLAANEPPGPKGPGLGGLPGIDRIAPAYNAESQIVVEVVSGQESRFDFDTKSK